MDAVENSIGFSTSGSADGPLSTRDTFSLFKLQQRENVDVEKSARDTVGHLDRGQTRSNCGEAFIAAASFKDK